MNHRPNLFRRKYFINKEFQGKLIFRYFILIAVASLLFIGLFSFFSSNTLSISYDDYQLKLGMTPGILFKKIISTQWIFIVVGGAAVIIMTLFMTHRVAGPFFRFERALREMIAGDITGKIYLRKKDEGHGLADKINQFNGLLAQRLKMIDDQQIQIGNALDDLEKIDIQSEKDPEKIHSLLMILRHCKENISQIVTEYKVEEKKEPKEEITE